MTTGVYDQGSVRTKPTPTPEILHKQLYRFKEMWRNVGKQPAAVKETCCHIDRGCLSGILPGRESNRNERLHKDINSHMKHNRYGVELTTLFAHNEHVRAKIENSVWSLWTQKEFVMIISVTQSRHELHDILSSMDISAFADTTLQELEVSP